MRFVLPCGIIADIFRPHFRGDNQNVTVYASRRHGKARM